VPRTKQAERHDPRIVAGEDQQHAGKLFGTGDVDGADRGVSVRQA
jgi:hypothetical protein